jgi:septal ring factor EnvC (AmiA/AmiB activator)
MKKSEVGFRLSDLSNKSLRELYERYIEAKDPVEIEALEAEIQKRKETIQGMWENIKKAVYELARIFSNVIRSPMTIKQYENEIQRVENLLKYTNHSKKRRKHERYLKWLRSHANEMKTEVIK